MSEETTMPDLRFMKLALDPTLIAGVYNGCDQWCDYCPLTLRCLAFRCRSHPDARGDIYHNIAAAMYASMHYLKERHEAEGVPVPEALTRLIADDPRTHVRYVPVDDALERMGRRYAIAAATFIATGDEVPQDIPTRAGGPTPVDVFRWYHVLIARKIYRAIMSAREGARTGVTEAQCDADLAVKVALLGVDRSDEALQVMALDDGDPRIEHLRLQLRRLRRELEARFPAARAVVRPGFDATGGR